MDKFDELEYYSRELIKYFDLIMQSIEPKEFDNILIMITKIIDNMFYLKEKNLNDWLEYYNNLENWRYIMEASQYIEKLLIEDGLNYDKEFIEYHLEKIKDRNQREQHKYESLDNLIENAEIEKEENETKTTKKLTDNSNVIELDQPSHAICNDDLEI